MRLIIAGGRDFNNYSLAKTIINQLTSKTKEEIQIFSGRCSDSEKGIHTFTTSNGIKVYGADGIGERWAQENGLIVFPYPADWQLYGKRAGPVRNEKMAIDATHAIVFWDKKSTGSKSMIKWAEFYKLPVRIINY